MTVASFSQRKSGWGKIWLVAIFLMASPLLVEWVQSIHYPISGEHYHRQADTFSVALNFLEHPNFFYPRVHHTYGKTGIHGMEAPIVPYTISLWLRIFGPHEWLGRVNTLLYFLLGLLAFLGYWQQGSPSHSRWLAGSVLFFSPMTLFYSRQIQPDMPMICIGLLGVYLALRSRRKPQRALWFATFVFALGVLTKYPLLFVWPAFVVAAIRWRTTSWWERVVRFAIACVPLFLVGLWMLWASYLERRYALGLPEYFAATPKPSEIWDNIKHFNLSHTVGHILPHYAITVLFFPIFVYGWLCSFQRQYREWAAPLWLWLLGSVLLVLMFTSRLHSHYYYAMLYLPPVWLFTALGLHRIWMWLCLAASPSHVSSEETAPESSPQHTYQEVPWVLAVYVVFFLLQTSWDVKHTVVAVVILVYTGFSVLLQRRGESFARYAKISAVWGISLFLCYTAIKASHDRFHERCTRLGNPYSFTERATVLRNLLRNRVAVDEPIVMVADYNPWFLHAAARKGWTHYDHVLFGSHGLDEYRQYGVRWLVVNQNTTHHTPRVLYSYAPVATAGEWKLYWIASPPSPAQIRPVQPSPAQIRLSPLSPAQIRPVQPSPWKIRPFLPSSAKVVSPASHPSKVVSPAFQGVLKRRQPPDPPPRIVPLKKRP